MLLVESGSRSVMESLLPRAIERSREVERIDLVTCYPGSPQGLDEAHSKVWRVWEYTGRERRKELYRELRERGYDIICILCTGEPIMTKWKWSLAWQMPAKVMIVNENSDWFWLDYSNWRTVRQFMLYRSGLTGANAVSTLGRLLIFPFTFLWLLTFAAWVHLRRKARA